MVMAQILASCVCVSHTHKVMDFKHMGRTQLWAIVMFMYFFAGKTRE